MPNALILVDLQNDFLPGGALAVPEGDRVVPLANKLAPKFDLAVATQDWHPKNHASFASNHPGQKIGDVIDLNGLRQILWPIHCVQGTTGADFAPGLDRARIHHVIQKGTDANIDSYSGFFDNGHRKETGLCAYLKSKGVRDLYILGLATDYCVKSTALDAVQLGFPTFVIEDACRGVDLQPGDVERAIDETRKAGVTITDSGAIVGR